MTTETNLEKVQRVTDEAKETLATAFASVADRLEAEIGNGRVIALMAYQTLLIDLCLPEDIDREFVSLARISLQQDIQGIIATAQLRQAERQGGHRSEPDDFRFRKLLQESIAHFQLALNANLAMARDLPSKTAQSMICMALESTLLDFVLGGRPAPTAVIEAAMSAIVQALGDAVGAVRSQ